MRTNLSRRCPVWNRIEMERLINSRSNQRFRLLSLYRFGTIIRHVVETNVKSIDRPLSELMLKYIHGRGIEDYGAEPDRLPLEAVLALELIREISLSKHWPC